LQQLKNCKSSCCKKQPVTLDEDTDSASYVLLRLYYGTHHIVVWIMFLVCMCLCVCVQDDSRNFCVSRLLEKSPKTDKIFDRKFD